MTVDFEKRKVAESRPHPFLGQTIYQKMPWFGEPDSKWMYLGITLHGTPDVVFTPSDFVALKPVYPDFYNEDGRHETKIISLQEFFSAEVVYCTLVYKYWWDTNEGR